MKKSWIYYGVAVAVVIAGVLLDVVCHAPVVNTTMFILSLLYLWRSVAIFLHLEPYVKVQYPRPVGIAMAFCELGFGVTWLMMSMTEASRRLLPILLSALPFLVLSIILSKQKKKDTDQQ